MALAAIKAILADQHPLGLTATNLREDTFLPIDWERQPALLGFPSAEYTHGP